MRYNPETIGNNSGKIWEVLNGSEEANISELTRKTNLKKEDVLLAIGWLSSEGKLDATKKGRGVKFKLK
ncbi:MAG: winged helix-turn-helix domain-containing protein [Fusobacteriota bacterium]